MQSDPSKPKNMNEDELLMDESDHGSPLTLGSTSDLEGEPSTGDTPEAPQPKGRRPSKLSRETRKRCRVTPEQLARLEDYFLHDQSPTAARRKLLGEELGMQERQTQIWFQNRRAKAKQQEIKRRMTLTRQNRHDTNSPSPLRDMDPLSLNYDDRTSIHIPCTDLAIGNWRRIVKEKSDMQDLAAYVSEIKRCLTWFVRTDDYCFKMELPFETIVQTSFAFNTAEIGTAVLVLSRPPTFYLHDVKHHPGRKGSWAWKRCGDWTEGHQASTILQHVVVGAVPHLLYALKCLRLPAVIHPIQETTSDSGSHPSPIGSDLSTFSPLSLQTEPQSLALDGDCQDVAFSLELYDEDALKLPPSFFDDILNLGDTPPIPLAYAAPAEYTIPLTPYPPSQTLYMSFGQGDFQLLEK